MSAVNIRYTLNLSNQVSETFDFNLDEESFDLITSDQADLPQWTELEYRQCSHCPLDKAEHSHCPLAANIHPIVERFHDTRSIDEVEMDVTTPERRVIQKTALQHAIASMFELILPVCGCPKTEHMKPLARFHLPLASEEETVFRVTSMYLLGQYFVRTTGDTGGRIELDGLSEIYEGLNILNKAVASRLQHATQSDSVKNAITLLDMYSTLVPVLVEDELAEMRGFFKAYMPEGQVVEAVTTNYLEKAKSFSMDLELEPVSGGDDDVPAWLKQQDEGDEDKSNDDEDNSMAVADKILASSGLSLSLEPMNDNDNK